MPSESDKHYILPEELRSELAKPLGTLVKGTIETTIPQLKRILLPKKGKIAGVGDVTAELLVENGFQPDIIITDGKTKRTPLVTWKSYSNYNVLKAKCPAAEITPEAWTTIKQAVFQSDHSSVHIRIFGEEDLLVLPLLIEMSDDSFVVYGQPNEGAVVLEVSTQSKLSAKNILSRMKIKDEV